MLYRFKIIARRAFEMLALASLLSPGPALAARVTAKRLAETRSLATSSLDQLMAVKGGIAGYSIVISAEAAPDFITTRGIANAATGAAVTPDTAFYIASMTKSYVGLLAARLDREGVLPLGTTLAQVWPGLKLPAPLDASTITLEKLLAHSGGLENEPLSDRTAYTDEVALEAYPRLLETGSRAGKQGFEYSNLGYLLYAAALQRRTGRDWKASLQDGIFGPLGLRQTYSRSSLVPPRDLSWGHRWSGSEWLPVAPKSDAIMHAAGGLFASSRDIALWMRAQLSDGRNAPGLTPADFRFTRTDRSGGGLGVGEYGISCNGYALGWSLCTFEGATLLYHGGTYEGVRTHLFLLPEQRVGVALLANSDGMTGGLGQEYMAVLASSLLGRPDTAARTEAMIAGYRNKVGRQVENRLRSAAASEADPKWQGWRWDPDAATLAGYQGLYHSDLFGELEIRLEGGRLQASAGALRRELRPSSPGKFAARLDQASEWAPVNFALDSEGRPRSVDFMERKFDKLAGSR